MEGKAMQIVNNHCGGLMQKYTQCVERFPRVWDFACSHQRHELARCSETHPAMLKVKSNCSQAFQIYQQCQRRYPDDISLCSTGFNNFLRCVERVASEMSSS